MVPARRTFRAVQLERHLGLWAEHRAVGLEGPPRPVVELDHRPDVVLVGDLAGGVSGMPPVEMRAVAGPGEGPLLHKGLLGRHHPADRADEMQRHVDGVTHQVGENPVSTPVLEESPRQRRQSIPSVHAEKTAPIMGQSTETSLLDELLGVLHKGHPPIVEPGPTDDTGIAGGLLDRSRSLGVDPHGLLAEHGLARRRNRFDDLAVEGGRCGDVDDIDIGTRDEVPPVDGADADSEPRGGEIESLDGGVGDHRDLGCELDVGEVGREGPVGANMCLTHPSETHYTDPDPTGHRHHPRRLVWNAVVQIGGQTRRSPGRRTKTHPVRCFEDEDAASDDVWASRCVTCVSHRSPKASASPRRYRTPWNVPTPLWITGHGGLTGI